jgi:hypothetical protein
MPRSFPLTPLFGIFLLCCACKGLREPSTVHIVVREQPGKVINAKAEYQLLDATTRLPIQNGSGQTNELGYFIIDKDKRPFSNLLVDVSYNSKRDTLALNGYVCYYDLYLGDFYKPVAEKDRVGDMHYHVSMKPHNSLAQFFYLDPKNPRVPPTTINWLKIWKKLQVFDDGSWCKPTLESDISDPDVKRKMQTFLEGNWVRSKEGANHLKNFTEATQPHTLEGNVYLAYNAISPFEHSVSNQGIKRFVSSFVKSGASIKWLTTMGDKNKKLTHWKNFNFEFDMISNQDKSFNNFRWDDLAVSEKPADKLDKPLVINVVEGAHILQDRYFPHFVNYDLMDSTTTEKQKLFNSIYGYAKEFNDTEVIAKCDSAINAIEALPTDDKKKDAKAMGMRHRVTNWVLEREMLGNVDALKKKNIHMISISHLSYNGITGHAPALDVSLRPISEWFISRIAQRAYSIRVSSDRQYKKAFDGLFYRVPGVNPIGTKVISRLMDASVGTRRIHIDLKHSDVATRRYLLNEYRNQAELGTKIPPICSHCAVNGLSIDYSSPLLNEYRLLKSSLARKFYPFAINLYNEEVKQFVELDGIIGIPLEERVLGGYLNNTQERPIHLKKSGSKIKYIDEPVKMKRYKYMRRGVQYLRQQNDSTYLNAAKFYRSITRGLYKKDPTDDEIHDLLFKEYCSAESFLQNIFHVVDIADKVNLENANKQKAAAYAIEYLEQIVDQDQVSSMVNKELKNESAKIQSAQMKEKRKDWKNICIGSDFDGMVDPLNICPTASQFPIFKKKLKYLIPLFIVMRKDFEQHDRLLGMHRTYDDYFDKEFTLDEALDMFFYYNLKDFTIKHF